MLGGHCSHAVLKGKHIFCNCLKQLLKKRGKGDSAKARFIVRLTALSWLSYSNLDLTRDVL